MNEKILKGSLLAGKKGLIMGVANDRSLAWGIARSAAAQGAELAFSYQGDALLKRVKPLATELESKILIDCDVSTDDGIIGAFKDLKTYWDNLDFVVHSIGFSDKNELKGKYYNTSRENFLNTMNISCYSFTSIAKHAAKMMNNGGSMITLTYYGAEKVMPNYNMMGVAKSALETSVKYLAVDLGEENIRVNAISAGPIRTLAASGIGEFRHILKWNEQNSPLQRNTTIEDVGGAAVYLLSDLASGTTGENLHVDSGYHVVGMKRANTPDVSTS